MKYAVEMVSSATISIPIFLKIDSTIVKMMTGDA
jgi:hypothetical protein